MRHMSDLFRPIFSVLSSAMCSKAEKSVWSWWVPPFNANYSRISFIQTTLDRISQTTSFKSKAALSPLRSSLCLEWNKRSLHTYTRAGLFGSRFNRHSPSTSIHSLSLIISDPFRPSHWRHSRVSHRPGRDRIARRNAGRKASALPERRQIASDLSALRSLTSRATIGRVYSHASRFA